MRTALGEIEGVAVVEPERNQGLTLIPRPGCALEGAVRDVLLRHNLKEVPLHIQAGRLDDVFHTLTHNVHE